MVTSNRSGPAVWALGCALVTLLFVAGGCGGATQNRSDVFAGRFTDGFETSAFAPCGTGERWWITGNTDALYRALYPGFPGSGLPTGFTTAYVEVTGRVSGPGKYGHLGAYRRELNVQSVLVVRATPPETCP